MMTIGDIILVVSLSIESTILLLMTSIFLLERKRIVIFLPFIFIGIFFGVVASVGFFAEIAFLDLFFMKMFWVILILWLTINLWRQKWN